MYCDREQSVSPVPSLSSQVRPCDAHRGGEKNMTLLHEGGRLRRERKRGSLPPPVVVVGGELVVLFLKSYWRAETDANLLAEEGGHLHFGGTKFRLFSCFAAAFF